MMPARPVPAGLFVGPWYAWWPGDPLPALPPLPGFAAAPADDADADAALVALAAVSQAELNARRETGNRPYLARLAGEPVACGWVADATIDIGELGLVRALPPGERYLWGFVTGERWRGRGIYPRLLQAILRREAPEAARYWIGHDSDNSASSRGILKAGFGRVGAVYRLPAGDFALVPTAPPDRAGVGAAILGATLREAG